MYRFNVPPAWPLSPDFVPPIGWRPEEDYPPVAEGWLFWELDESSLKPYLVEMYEHKHGAVFSRKTKVTQLKANYKLYLAKHQKLEKLIMKAHSERFILSKTGSAAIYQKLPLEAKVEQAIISSRNYYLARVLVARAILDKEYVDWLEANPLHGYTKPENTTSLNSPKNLNQINKTKPSK